jgi:hypothetical protein
MKDKLNDFDKADHALVISELNSITLDHVMAKSAQNLNNTRAAILQLSKGDFNKLEQLVKAAKIDFRDVIYWASIENEKKNT